MNYIKNYIFQFILVFYCFGCVSKSNISNCDLNAKKKSNIGAYILLFSLFKGVNTTQTFLKKYQFNTSTKGTQIKEDDFGDWLILGETNFKNSTSQLFGKISSQNYNPVWLKNYYVSSSNLSDCVSFAKYTNQNIITACTLYNSLGQYQILLTIINSKNGSISEIDPMTIFSTTSSNKLQLKNIELITEGKYANSLWVMFDVIYPNGTKKTVFVMTDSTLSNLRNNLKIILGSDEYIEEGVSVINLSNDIVNVLINTNEYGINSFNGVVMNINITDASNLDQTCYILENLNYETYFYKQLITNDKKINCMVGYIKYNMNKDILVVCLNNNNIEKTVRWAKKLGFSLDDVAYDIIETKDGNIAIVGSSIINQNEVSNSIKLVFDTSGNIVFEKTYFDNGCSNEQIDKGIIQTTTSDKSLVSIGYNTDITTNYSTILISKTLDQLNPDCMSSISTNITDLYNTLVLTNCRITINSAYNFQIQKFHDLNSNQAYSNIQNICVIQSDYSNSCSTDIKNNNIVQFFIFSGICVILILFILKFVFKIKNLKKQLEIEKNNSSYFSNQDSPKMSKSISFNFNSARQALNYNSIDQNSINNNGSKSHENSVS